MSVLPGVAGRQTSSVMPGSHAACRGNLIGPGEGAVPGAGCGTQSYRGVEGDVALDFADLVDVAVGTVTEPVLDG